MSQTDAELGRREAVLRVNDISEESIAQAMAANELFFKGAVTPFTEAEYGQLHDTMGRLSDGGKRTELQAIMTVLEGRAEQWRRQSEHIRKARNASNLPNQDD